MFLRCSKPGFWARCTLALVLLTPLKAQTTGALSEFFEGKQVVVKMDMPATQQGVDVYPQRPQPLDVNSYSKRLKQFGISVRNGDSVMITKVKVKDNSIEFQLAGGGYGTAFDDTDSSVHFTPSDKSDREKELQRQLDAEQDPARRRSLQRQVDDLRSERERRDRRDLTRAREAADIKRQEVQTRRLQGGSRFNIRFKKGDTGGPFTAQSIMTTLDPYVTFPPASFGAENHGPSLAVEQTDAAAGGQPAAAAEPAPANALKKGLTRDQVDALYGTPTETHDRTQEGLKITTCTYLSKDANIQADFVNGVLVQYTVSSR